MRKRFGHRLRELRLLAGLTQQELARRAHLSDRFLGRVERGDASPSVESLDRLAETLGAHPASHILTCRQDGDHDADPTDDATNRDLMGITLAGWWTYTTDTGAWELTAGVRAVLGLEPDAPGPDGERLLDLVDPRDRERAQGLLSLVRKGQDVPKSVLRVIRRDGFRRLVLVHAQRAMGNAGDGARVIGALVDITEHERHDAMLLATSARVESLVQMRTAHLTQQLRLLRDQLSATCQEGGDDAWLRAWSAAAGMLRHFRGVTIKYVDTAMRLIWQESNDNSVRRVRPGECGQPCHAFNQGLDGPCQGCLLPDVLRTGEPQEGETTPPNGRTFITRGHPVRDASGALRGVLMMSLEITQRKHMEEALHRTHLWLEHLLATSPVVLYSCEAGGDYQVTFISDNVRELFGHPPTAFMSGNGYWREHLAAGEYERLTANLPTLFAAGRLVQVYRFRHGNGSWRWIRDELRLVRGPGGAPQEIVGSWLDVTDIKATELALRESESRHRGLFQATGAAQLLLDAEAGVVLDANPAACALLGKARGEILHADAVAACPGFGKALNACLEGHLPGDGRDPLTLRADDAGPRRLELVLSPIEQGNRLTVHVLLLESPAPRTR